ncbi:MAG: hypothetical protein PHZ03_10795 [Syntrophomonas sp.]|nr:hypothetical protein [Syntrophomonas sp.]
MKNIVEVSTDILQLSLTIQEGFQHLVGRMGEGHFEDTYYLFQDIVRAFSSIYDAVRPLSLVSPLGESQIAELTEKLINAFDDMNKAYENNELDKAQQDLQVVLFPAFESWRGELERCLHPLVDS